MSRHRRLAVLVDGPDSSVPADGLDRAFLEGGQARGLLRGIGRLLGDVAAAARIVAAEIRGAVSRQRSQSMQVAST